MGHYLRAIVARPDTLRAFSERHARASTVALEQGCAMVPLTDGLLDEIGLGPPREGVAHWRDALVAELGECSRIGPIAYLETNYFGGLGTQSAMAFRNGEIAIEYRESSFGPINEALAIIGVERGDSRDEFESVGLQRFRRIDDWEEFDEH